MLHCVGKFFDLKDAQFFVTPKPYEEELLSSWLARVSYEHLTLPSSFLNMHFPEYGKNVLVQRDIDVWANDELIEKIAYKSGYSFELIKDLTLRSYEGILFDKINPNAKNKHIMQLGNKASYKYKRGLRYCIKCLEEQFYFRKYWRLDFYNICNIHNTFMDDCCKSCGAPLNILRCYRRKYEFDRCYKCGKYLINSF